MFAIGLLLSTFGIGLFCWLILAHAVYAWPFSVGLTVGIFAFDNGAGAFGAFFMGIFAGAVTLGLGQVAFALARPVALRAVIGAAFAIPAAIAGYHAVLGLSQIGVPSLLWREFFAWAGSIAIGCTAWARMTILADPLSVRSASSEPDTSQRVLTAATGEG